MRRRRALQVSKRFAGLLNLPATLIAGNRFQNGTGEEIKNNQVSIDKVTMMIKTVHNDLEIDYSLLNHYIKAEFSRYLTEVPNTNYIESYKFVYDDKTDFHLSFNPKFSQPTKYGCRIEFNPNKIDWAVFKVFLGKIISYFPNVTINDLIRFNRLDIAIDVPVNLNPSLITVSGSQKGFVASGNRGIESVYFGHRSSEYFLRVYNKKLELAQKQKINYLGKHLWRIELEMKKEFNPFQSLDFIYEYFSKLKFFSNARATGDYLLDLILFKANSEGFSLNSVLKEIPKTTRYRLKKKLNKISDMPDIDILKDIKEQLPGVFDNLIFKLKKSLEASPA